MDETKVDEMRNWVGRPCLFLGFVSTLLCFLLGALGAKAEDQSFLEIVISTADGQYEVLFEFGKPGASTCDLSTPNGEYSLDCADGRCVPSQEFLDDHSTLSFAELTTALELPWILVWDADLDEEVMVSVDFGSIEEDEFPGMPILLNPEDGAIYVRPDPNPITIDWTYDQDPCEAQPDAVDVVMHGPGGIELVGDEVTKTDCSITEWTPPLPLGEGLWDLAVFNSISLRDIPTGLTIDPPGSWEFDNTDWLSSLASTEADFAVPAGQKSYGAIKGLFR